MIKTSLISGLCLVACGVSGWALPNPAPTPAPGPAPTAAQPAKYTSSELDLLFKPVALYPDPLLAQMLPAASYPAQIEAANTFLKANPKGEVDQQPWDASVKALAHYPEVVEQMAQDLAWTEALGQAAATQMSDVNSSIQRLRSQAYAAGNLQSNEQQTVTTDSNYVTIQPASPQILYVPVYNPYLVYAPRPSGWSGSLISFGLGYACGSWLTYGYDWYGNSFFRYPYGCYYGSYWGNPGYRSVSYVHNTYNYNNGNCWRPTYGAYNSYNTCYRPGNNWSRLPGCNYSNGGSWTSSNFYRPGGSWSHHIGTGWNSPASHAPGNWNQSGSWNRSGYRPGGNWSTPGNSRYNSGWANHQSSGWTGNSGWSNGHQSNGWSGSSGWTGHQSNGWSGNSGWTGHRSNGWSGNSGWTGHQSNGWSGNSGWTGHQSNGWSGNSGWTGHQSNGWSGNSGWTSGHHSSGGFSMPSSGGWSGGHHSSGGGGFSMPSRSGGWSGGGHHGGGHHR
ncbi:DUF3300 domain-containing protein [bacterium]|nr:DUF3300 domain-containing protein [bacterium]